MNTRRVRILAPVFFERFFDNEMAAGAGSLKTPLFWLLGFLMVPGLFMPLLMSSTWSFVAKYYGLGQLDIVVRADKVIFLGYVAWAVGVVVAVSWNALLLDRRDGLVLGALPVNSRDIVLAKTLALVAYVAMVLVAMSAGASFMFGLFLIDARGPGSVIATTSAHFFSCFALGLWIATTAVALQGAALGLFGGRLFAKISPLLQLAFTAVVLTSFFTIGPTANAALDTIAGAGPHNAPWILRLPTMWFLGLYEVLLGFREPVFITLCWRAVAALVLSTAIAAFALPLSYRRMIVATVEQAGVRRGPGVFGWILRRLPIALFRSLPARAVSDFFLASVSRHSGPRLAIASAVGAAIAWCGPVLVVQLKTGIPQAPTAALLGLPIVTALLLVAGFRVAASVPSELPPRWMFGLHHVPVRVSRTAVRRTTLLLGGILPAVPFAIVYFRWWGAAIVPAVVMWLTCAVLVAELAFRAFDGVPCGRKMQGDGANLRLMWPVYLAAFTAASSLLPALVVAWSDRPERLWPFVLVPLVIAVGVRLASLRSQPAPVDHDDEPPQVQVPDL